MSPARGTSSSASAGVEVVNKDTASATLRNFFQLFTHTP
ncbi:Hypothetical protein Cul131001_0718 [Corynebacterium ulcerans]|nr:Hypothetical protein Cul131001_0718 [Corynebacterium ulcerans]